MNTLKLYSGLFKIPLSLMIAFSAIFGFIMFNSRPDGSLLLCGTGIFMLACGGACLNNFQDRHIDRLFSRTRKRVLPSGALPPKRALILSIIMMLFGIIALYLIHYDFLIPLLGAAAIVLYNGVYTPLKTRTLFAIVPGILCGMLPPLIGWIAAGGDFFSLSIMGIMVLFGIWQIPHFWLILLNHSADYTRSPIPNMMQCINRFQLEKIVFIWIINFAFLLIIIPVLFLHTKAVYGWVIAASAFLLIIVISTTTFLRRSSKDYSFCFALLNGTVLLAMLVAISDRLM